uniref:ABC transmembrane type-1 domain-containing protein n=1 Tax=Mesocestoides corti TaxID=53468 RepID=A0A5K3FZN6_MESCO
MGTHEELLAKGGIYASMIAKQPHVDKYEEDESGSSSEDELSDNEFPNSSEMHRKESIRTSEPSEHDNLSSVDTNVSVLRNKKTHALLEALAMNKPEWPYLFYGLVASTATGVTLPMFSLVYAEIYGLFGMQDPSAKRERASFLSGIFAMLGFLRLFFASTGNAALGVAGARLTKRTRRLFFKAILKQEVAWFDRPENQAGLLTARLATEVQSLHRVTGTQLGIFFESFGLVVSALTIAFLYSWKLTLVAMAFVPALFLAGTLQTRQLSGGDSQKQGLEANVAQEAFTSYRTVAAFGLEKAVYEKFRAASKKSPGSRYCQSLLFAVVHCLANGTFFFLIAAYFYTAAVLFDRKELDLPSIFRIFSAVNFAAQGLGRAATYAPDFKTASQKIKNTLSTIHRETRMDVNEGLYPSEPLKAIFEFKNVYFRYPTRRRVRILKVSYALCTYPVTCSQA